MEPEAVIASTLGPYEIGEELGRTASGVVLAGRHRMLGHDVAIKLLTDPAFSDPAVRAKLGTLADLDHPNIVRVHEVVETAEVCALVMEPLSAGSLRTRSDKGGLSAQAACAAVVATCDALHYAHGKGVAHGDIKPESLVFSEAGVLKVADFGLADLVGRDAPQQGAPAPSSDVRAVGLLLDALVRRDPTLPRGLRDVVSRATARAADSRYATAQELALAIDAAAVEAWGRGWAPDRQAPDPISDALQGACAGRGVVAVISGPSASRKTRLAALAVDQARARGIPALAVQGDERRRDVALALVRRLFAPVTDDPAGRARYGVPHEASAEQLVSLAVDIAVEGPLALIVDDVHWADAESLGVLLDLVSRLDRVPIALIVTRAVSVPGARDDLLDRLARQGARVQPAEAAPAPPADVAAAPRAPAAAADHAPPAELRYARPVDEALIARLEDELTALEGGDPGAQVRVLCRLVVELHLSGARARSEALAERAVEIARVTGGAPAQLAAAYGRLVAAWSPDRLGDRLTAVTQLVSAARASNDREMACRGLSLRIRALLEAGDTAAADDEMTALEEAAGHDLPVHRWEATAYRALRALHGGRPDEGLELVHAALRAGDGADAHLARRCADAQLAMHAWIAGRPRDVVPALRRAIDSAPWLPVRRAALAFGLAEMGRRTEAIATFEPLAADGFAPVPFDGNWTATMALLAFACARLDDAWRAAMLYETLRPYAGRLAVCGDGITCWGSIDAALGALAGTLGHHEVAAEHLDRAQDAARRQGLVVLAEQAGALRPSH